MMTMMMKKKKTQIPEEETNPNPFLKCAHLVLPWLTHQELANTSLTCKSLSLISSSVTLHRSLDASRSLEPHHPIPFINPLPHDPFPYAFFLYSPSQLLPSRRPPPCRQPWGSPSPLAPNPGDAVEAEEVSCGCDCEGCGDGGGSSSGFELEEEIRGECGPGCGCRLGCGNRVTQRGVSVKLKIVRDERKGWGLFADQLIRHAQFVCEYAGELLTTQEARSRQQIYDELTSNGKFFPALLVVREHLPSGKACLRMNIDATRIGNVARFINHSCDGGNLSTVLVRSNGVLLPRVCFFASRDIKPGEELSFSYGETGEKDNGLQCFCGSSCCHGVLPSEDT